MAGLVRYRRDGRVATITMDDGKVNALSPAMLAELGDALSRALDDGAAVVLEGRDGVFSAGFDLKVLRGGGPAAATMVRTGFTTAERILSFPLPVVVACTGHAFAMGTFLLLSGDYRVGAQGPFTYAANEVAIGLTMPYAAVEILRQRLTPACFHRATVLAEPFGPDTGVAAGFLDRIVGPDVVSATAHEVARGLADLDMAAFQATKLRACGATLEALRLAIATDTATLRERDALRGAAS